MGWVNEQRIEHVHHYTFTKIIDKIQVYYYLELIKVNIKDNSHEKRCPLFLMIIDQEAIGKDRGKCLHFNFGEGQTNFNIEFVIISFMKWYGPCLVNWYDLSLL